MCDAFVGTWKMVSSENFDDYMKEVGKQDVAEGWARTLLWTIGASGCFHLGALAGCGMLLLYRGCENSK